jgi:hypothetical protein
MHQWKMGRVREKKWRRKKEKWREREEEEETSPPDPHESFAIGLRKEMLNTRQRLKMKVELAIKFSPPKILSWIRSEFLQQRASCASSYIYIDDASRKLNKVISLSANKI